MTGWGGVRDQSQRGQSSVGPKANISKGTRFEVKKTCGVNGTELVIRNLNVSATAETQCVLKYDPMI